MAADTTYQSKVYRKNGGEELVVASGGQITVESGGEITIESGGILNLESLTNGAPGAGISGGTRTVFKSSVQRVGDIIKTSILIDLTGLSSSTTDLDIIGTGSSVAYLGQITEAKNGTILSGRMTCLEAPTGGVADIDLYSATEATGKFDDAIGGLEETALITAGGNWTLAAVKAFGAIPAANKYLYLTGGAGGTADAYTAGKFLIELEGYEA
jgi:hypothetical protein